MNHKNAVAYFSMGDAYYYLGRYEEAIVCYNKALELNPKDEIAYNN